MAAGPVLANEHPNPQERPAHATVLLHELDRAKRMRRGVGFVLHELWPQYARVARLTHNVVVHNVTCTHRVGQPVVGQRNRVLVITIHENI